MPLVAIDVQTDVFQGPFDLLLHLILRDQVDLYEVSLTKIVDAYLTHLSEMSEMDLDVATEFLLIAATLSAGTVLAIVGHSRSVSMGRWSGASWVNVVTTVRVSPGSRRVATCAATLLPSVWLMVSAMPCTT